MVDWSKSTHPYYDFQKDEVAVKFTYINGDYELVHHRGQARFWADGTKILTNAFYIFDEEEFRQLLEKYYVPDLE